jgi:hypothetical protein
MFSICGSGTRKLRAITYQAQTGDDAVRYAKAILKHEVIQDKRTDLCLVKFGNGEVFSVVFRDA